VKIEDTLGFLLGRWELSRSYTDHRSGTDGTFRGQAVLTVTRSGDAAGGLARARYEETGELCFGSYRAPASRSLEYRQQADGTVMLYRPGAQPYIELDLASGVARASHPCGADHYETSVVVQSRDVVEEHWRVRGPDKDYTAVTVMRRVAEP
jgi:Family of unknown function (DUF6314)